MNPTVASTLEEFAFYGFTESPLTTAEIERAIAAGLDAEDIYRLGCDCGCGFRFNEVFDLYPSEKETADAHA